MHQTVVCHLYPWIHQTFTCELKYAIHCKGTDIGHLLHQSSSISALPEHPLNRDVSVAQLVASMSGVVLGVVVMVVGSNLIRGKIFTASIGSVDSMYLSIFIYCMNLHQFVILCSSKAMMFVKLYYRTSDIYLIFLVSLEPSGFHLRTK